MRNFLQCFCFPRAATAAVAFSEMVTRHPERYFCWIFMMCIFSKHMGRILFCFIYMKG